MSKSPRKPGFAVQVNVRVKPCEGGSLPGEIGSFRTLGSECSQETAFDTVAPALCESFLQGCNCTLFVYGQTGSGKTHTLFGPPSCFARHLLHEAGQEGQDFPAAWGVFPRAAMQFLRQGPLTASVAEVYMNNCFDLLNNRNQVQVAGSKKCSIAAHGPEFFSKEMSSFKVAGQTQMTLQNLQDVLSLMSIVDGSRTTKSHAINDRSSRSHCIVTVTTPRTGGKFLFVDLAGSERIAKSLAPDNFLANSAGHVLDIRAEEAKNINLSLTALARVIAALAKSSPFVPFRDSVLTMMLKDSLAGNCRTAVVVTVSEDPQHQEETISSLGFARLCQSVKTEVTQLKARDAGDVVKVRQQLQQLEQQLAELEAKGGAGGVNPSFPKTTREGFVANQRKLMEHIGNLRSCKAALTELKAAKKEDSAEFLEKSQQRSYEESQITNLKGILIRSQSTGVWKEPSKPYIYKLAAKRELQHELAALGEHVQVQDSFVMTLKDLLS
ncbi:unnamed protein product [Effrenium voratum]|nr:unnamed protein product [Effrenium voratum]